MNFCVLGAGAWGTAMAVYLSKCGHSVSLIPRRVEHALTLSSDRENKDYLPGVNFDQDLQIGCSLRPVLMECDYLFFSCPSHALRESCKQVRLHKDDSWQLKGGIALCKGLEPQSNLFAHEVIQEELGDEIGSGYLTGPSHAHDVAINKPTAMVLAMANSRPSTPVVSTNIEGSMTGDASQKAMTAESGTPITKSAAISGITPQEQKGDKPPAAAAIRIMTAGEPVNARAIKPSAPVAPA